MTAQILDGQALAETTKTQLKQQIIDAEFGGWMKPALAVILVGDDSASQIYVRHKRKACAAVGMDSHQYDLPANTSEAQLLELIQVLNDRDDIHGILVQLPLSDHIDENKVILAIDPDKDVDGFHPLNIGRLARRMPHLRPCTPLGIIRLLEHHHIELAGKHTVVVGASNIVGRPMILEFLWADATVTVCHRQTDALRARVADADVLVSATGVPELILGSWLKPGAVVIDVGMNRLSDGRLVGDVEFESAAKTAAWITPVPGGVGPMTVATLLSNTLLAQRLQNDGKLLGAEGNKTMAKTAG